MSVLLTLHLFCIGVHVVFIIRIDGVVKVLIFIVIFQVDFTRLLQIDPCLVNLWLISNGKKTELTWSLCTGLHLCLLFRSASVLSLERAYIELWQLCYMHVLDRLRAHLSCVAWIWRKPFPRTVLLDNLLVILVFEDWVTICCQWMLEGCELMSLKFRCTALLLVMVKCWELSCVSLSSICRVDREVIISDLFCRAVLIFFECYAILFALVFLLLELVGFVHVAVEFFRWALHLVFNLLPLELFDLLFDSCWYSEWRMLITCNVDVSLELTWLSFPWWPCLLWHLR